MSACVLDGSAALAWVLPGEGGADALLDAVAEMGATVPPLWPFEVANVLLIAERRGRITPHEHARASTVLGALPIRIDAHATERVWTDTLDLARSHRLTVYDASYLELAIRLDLPLASLDAALRAAASARGVPLTI